MSISKEAKAAYDKRRYITAAIKENRRILTGSENAIAKIRKYERTRQRGIKKRIYDHARYAIGGIRIADTGKTYKELFNELRKQYEEDFKKNPPKVRRSRILADIAVPISAV